MTINVISLDLGTKTGWAIRHKDGSVISGSENFKQDRFQSHGMRYVNFRNWLIKIIKLSDISIVAFEEVRRHISTDSAHSYGGYLSIMQSVCADLKVEYYGVPVGTIKKFIYGSGRASKNDVMSSVSALGYKFNDDNEADAIALLLFFTKNL